MPHSKQLTASFCLVWLQSSPNGSTAGSLRSPQPTFSPLTEGVRLATGTSLSGRFDAAVQPASTELPRRLVSNNKGV